MPNEPDTTAAPTARPGPSLLAERTLSGIFVHLLGVATWFVLPGVVYLVSEHDFTRANARNAVNWQVFYSLVTVATTAAFVAVAGIDSILPGGLPDAFNTGLVLAVGGGLYGLGVAFFLNLAFSLVATAKAVFGGAWRYPMAPEVVGWVGSRSDDGSQWWLPVAAYALVAPMLFVNVVLSALRIDVSFWLFAALLLATVVGAPLAAAALVRDARHLRATDAPWQPNWKLYVGGPLGVAAITYLLRARVLRSVNPLGDAQYGFMFALWVASVVYVYGRHDRVERP